MEVRTCILTQNPCYQQGRKLTPAGVMVHSTGANNPYLSRYVQPDDGRLGKNPHLNDWNRPEATACVHAFIGKTADGSVAVYQTLPWDMRGWHCGKGTSGKSANNTHIAFEICEDGLNREDYFQKAYRAAVALTARLCKKYRLDPMAGGVVICHQEGFQLGIASNHADVLHWFPKFGKTMTGFRRDTAAAMEKEDF